MIYDIYIFGYQNKDMLTQLLTLYSCRFKCSSFFANR